MKDTTIIKVTDYFKENFLQDSTKNQLENLDYNLRKNGILAASIYSYICHKIITNEKIQSIPGQNIILDDYAFSHFLLLIELITKTRNKKAGRVAFVSLLKECIDKDHLKQYLWDTSINGNQHIYCYEWSKDSIKKIPYNHKCDANFDLDHHLEKGNYFPQFKNCIENYKKNSYDSFGSFLYELRCNYAHNAISASLGSISVLIKNNCYIIYGFGKRISLLSLEHDVFSILWKEKFNVTE
ncbi:hypothetical protein M1145_02050 [Patescibacteria group bacterium]|nr:hypothetical protein [Patescibacteria group bacterium]